MYYESSMQTLVLRIPVTLAKEMETEARELDVTKSEIARRRLIAGGPQRQNLATGFDLIADLIGTVEDGPSDISARTKDYLKSKGYGKSRRSR
jgi:hypothetical protein